MLVNHNELHFDHNKSTAAVNITEAHQINLKDRNSRMPCNEAHVRLLDESKLTDLAEHQLNGKGMHKCCQCAYNSGYKQGSLLQTFISLDIDSLGDSHTSANGPYKSIHQAFALGYSDGVNAFISS
jgi:hypothetical protein